MRVLLILSALLVGCSSEEILYVPGPEFYQKVDLSVSSSEIEVGEVLILKVSRETAGWIEKPSSEVNTDDPNQCWYRGSPPPKYEEEVSPNIAFKATPEGYQRYGFDLNGRTVMFTNAGEYQIKGHSSLWCAPGATSNTVAITVHEGN
ncbi:hypothetical protein QQF73_11595 [Marinobacter sp. M216]|uniref:Proteinase inhibitor I42 chagasin domain-containing protein n=1 Tax=Marinobacter albus TaxID=3030833 RepID=A0ABT7HFK0_9GAMM|nr:hypothetical protein [Marinobacter sp. M216]MDK9558265.1 hypothetical protein [Marinobacter sp. M216]